MTFSFYEGLQPLLYGGIYGGRKFLTDGEGYASAVGDEMAMHTVQNRTGDRKPWSHKHWRVG